MGRELRRVPVGWKHPLADNKNEPFWWNGQLMQIKPEALQKYQPMHDQTWEEAMADWRAERKAFFAPENKAERERIYAKYGKMSFREWHGDPPDKESKYYRPEWPKDAVMGYCVYETVSEGSPVSPVFETEEQVFQWLISEGYSEGAAEEFMRGGYAPSFIIVADNDGTRWYNNIEGLNAAINADDKLTED